MVVWTDVFVKPHSRGGVRGAVLAKEADAVVIGTPVYFDTSTSTVWVAES